MDALRFVNTALRLGMGSLREILAQNGRREKV